MRRVIRPIWIFTKEENKKYFFGNWNDNESEVIWHEIPKSLYDELIAYDLLSGDDIEEYEE